MGGGGTGGGGTGGGGMGGGTGGGGTGGGGTGGGGTGGGGTGGGTGGGGTGGGTGDGGTGGGTGGGGTGGGTGAMVDALYPTNGARWNDWVANDGTSIHTASGATCNFASAATASRDACLHAGELRVFTAPALTSCAGVTITDALGAFEWTCDATGGAVRALSVRLMPGVNLADLLDWTASPVAFKSNSVTVTNGTTTASSSSHRWWSNPIVEPVAGGNLANAPSTSNTIFIVTQNQAHSYALTEPKLSLVVKPGVSLLGSTAAGAGLVDAVTLNGPVWIEGRFDASGNAYAIRVAAAPFSVLRNIEALNATGTIAPPVRLGGGNVTASDLWAHNNVTGGFALNDSWALAEDIRVENSGPPFAGLSIGSLGAIHETITVRRVVAINNNDGVYVGSGPVDLRDVVTANNAATGLFGEDYSSRLYLRNVRALHNGNNGIRIAATRSVFIELSAIGNLASGFAMGGVSDDNVYVGLLSAANQGLGFSATGYTDYGGSIWVALTAVDNFGTGLDLGRNFHTLSNLAIANNASTSTSTLGARLGGPGYRVHNLALGVNGTSYTHDLSVTNSAAASPVVFSGNLQVSDATRSCLDVVAPYAPKGINNQCANFPTVLSDGGVYGSNAMLFQTGLPYWTFAGPLTHPGSAVPGDDLLNQSDDAGATLASAITDWARFENRFRGWAKDGPYGPDHTGAYDGGAGFYGWPGPTFRGACTTGTCRVWDYSLRGTAPLDGGSGSGGGADIYLRNRLSGPANGNAVLVHRFGGYLNVSLATCQEVPGAVFSGSSCTLTFLQNTLEILDDGVGNENGLCESNERCVITPNYGAYQGHGNLVAQGSIGAGGVIENVQLFRYDTNGR